MSKCVFNDGGEEIHLISCVGQLRAKCWSVECLRLYDLSLKCENPVEQTRLKQEALRLDAQSFQIKLQIYQEQKASGKAKD